MMDDLDYSIDVLTSLMNTDSSFNELTTEDRIYQGDYKKWIKFANSLKLRIAIRKTKKCRSGICEGKSGRSGSTPVWSDGQQ